MKAKSIVLFDRRDSGWYGFLSEYFEDTSANLNYIYEVPQMSVFLDKTPPDMAFVTCEMLTLGLVQKLKLIRESRPDFRLFHLGPVSKPQLGLGFDEALLEPLDFFGFQRQIVKHLPLSETIRVLFVDDEPAASQSMAEYLADFTQPRFVTHYESDGRKALALLEEQTFDVMVLDIKMPAMDGREVYREVRTRGIDVPVIIFFDAIFGDEMMEINKYGKPAVVEKGSRSSTLSEMAALLKKTAFFR